MLEFIAHDGIEVYAGVTGFICFKSNGDILGTEEQIVCLTIGQFRSVIKNSQALIDQAEENKATYTSKGE